MKMTTFAGLLAGFAFLFFVGALWSLGAFLLYENRFSIRLAELLGPSIGGAILVLLVLAKSVWITPPQKENKSFSTAFLIRNGETAEDLVPFIRAKPTLRGALDGLQEMQLDFRDVQVTRVNYLNTNPHIRQELISQIADMQMFVPVRGVQKSIPFGGPPLFYRLSDLLDSFEITLVRRLSRRYSSSFITETEKAVGIETEWVSTIARDTSYPAGKTSLRGALINANSGNVLIADNGADAVFRGLGEIAVPEGTTAEFVITSSFSRKLILSNKHARIEMRYSISSPETLTDGNNLVSPLLVGNQIQNASAFYHLAVIRISFEFQEQILGRFTDQAEELSKWYEGFAGYVEQSFSWNLALNHIEKMAEQGKQWTRPGLNSR